MPKQVFNDRVNKPSLYYEEIDKKNLHQNYDNIAHSLNLNWTTPFGSAVYLTPIDVSRISKWVISGNFGKLKNKETNKTCKTD